MWFLDRKYIVWLNPRPVELRKVFSADRWSVAGKLCENVRYEIGVAVRERTVLIGSVKMAPDDNAPNPKAPDKIENKCDKANLQDNARDKDKDEKVSYLTKNSLVWIFVPRWQVGDFHWILNSIPATWSP